MSRHIVVAGLAPSGSLAPSATLAPAATIYSGGPITPQAIAMGIGPGGSLVDVTSYIEFGDGVTYTYGRQTEFDDVQPGTFTFTLDNSDGRFTPENPGSPLVTKVAEGMSVCWQLGARLVRGAVLSVEIPADDSTWHQLVVTCDDMLGAGGRHMLSNLADALVEHSGADLLWRLDEPDGSTSAAEVNDDGLGAFTVHSSNPSSTTDAVTYGIEQIAGLPGTAVTVTAAPGETNWFGTRFGNTAPVSDVTTPAVTPGSSASFGFWNLWVYPGSTINLAITPMFANGPGYSYSMQLQCTPTTIGVKGGTNAPTVYTMSAAEQLVPHYVSMRVRLVWQTSSATWALFLDLFVDGNSAGSTFWQDPQHGYNVPGSAGSLAPVQVNVSVTNPAGAASNLTGTVQRVSHTARGAGLEENALYDSLDERRAVLDFIADEISSATYDGPLSAARIGFPDIDNTSILDVLNDIVRSESGHLFCTTTGTLLAPVEQIQVRARDRPTTPKAVFDATDDLDGPPAFIRDITNVAAQLEVTGPTESVTVTDPTVTGRYVTSGTSETVLFTDMEDLREWGQDRLYRGRNRAVRAQTFTVDAMTTPIDRSGDLLALVPGDRVQLATLPAARLGFASWDGWLIGGSETHTVTSHAFVLTVTPTLPDAAEYDESLFASDGDVTLAATITSTATTLTVAIASGSAMSTVLPYTLQLGSEQVTVTAVSGATLTVTRGAGGTTAAAHTTGTPIEVVPTALFAY